LVQHFLNCGCDLLRHHDGGLGLGIADDKLKGEVFVTFKFLKRPGEQLGVLTLFLFVFILIAALLIIILVALGSVGGFGILAGPRFVFIHLPQFAIGFGD